LPVHGSSKLAGLTVQLEPIRAALKKLQNGFQQLPTTYRTFETWFQNPVAGTFLVSSGT